MSARPQKDALSGILPLRIALQSLSGRGRMAVIAVPMILSTMPP